MSNVERHTRSSSALKIASILSVISAATIAGIYLFVGEPSPVLSGVIAFVTLLAWINWWRSGDDNPIPSRGILRRPLGLVANTLQLNGLVPSRGRAERRELKREEEIDRLEQEVIREADRRSGLITTLGSKGGTGKSWLSTLMAFALWRLSGRTVLLLDFNRTNGTTRYYAGVSYGAAVTVGQLGAFVAQQSKAGNPVFSQDVEPSLAHTNGVFFVDSDKPSRTAGKGFPMTELRGCLTYINHGARFAIADTDNTIDADYNLALAEASGALVFPTRPTEPYLSSSRDTRLTFAAVETLTDKVRRGVTAVTRVTRHTKLGALRVPGHLSLPEDQVLLSIPYDVSADRDDSGGKPVKHGPLSIDELHRETYLALLRVLLAALKQLPKVEDKIRPHIDPTTLD